jgi:secreted trypsin-like serine protease
MADCRALAKIYGWGPDSPLYSPAEAAMMLGNACVAGMIETCSEAVNVLRSDDIPESPHSNASITLWHDTACGAGSQRDCVSLGEHLLDSYSDADHRARGYAVLIQVCESGDLYTCGDLDKRTSEDPDAPLLAADSRFMPPLTAEEEAAIARQIERERAAGNRATVTCVSSRVTFRGVTYDDRQCTARKVKVVRGRLTREGEAPWQALIWRPEQMNGHRLTTGQRVECGGALIRAGWVLTAAHCVIDAKRRLTLTPGYEVRLGVLDASKPDGVSYGIRQVYAHPRYHAGSRTFDIALVELETRRQVRVGTPQTIKLILLEGTTINQRAPQAGAPVYVFGWGHTAFRGQSSAQLKVAEMALEDGAKCNGDNSLIGSFRGTILCAKAADRSQACDGDSGGPLVSYEGRPTVIGVVSAGTECGRTGKATRYTRVSAMRDWINKVLAGQEAPIAAP